MKIFENFLKSDLYDLYSVHFYNNFIFMSTALKMYENNFTFFCKISVLFSKETMSAKSMLEMDNLSSYNEIV